MRADPITETANKVIIGSIISIDHLNKRTIKQLINWNYGNYF